jgi:ketosteroid isomerase-like protein
MSLPGSPEAVEQEVLDANHDFYRALQALDLGQMEAVWLHEDWVKCLHPGWDLMIGWEEVRESWENIFRSTSQMRVTISRPLTDVVGEAAWVSCLENVTSLFEGGFSIAHVEATNIFVRRDGRWKMVYRHAAPLPEAPSGAGTTVQ